MSRTAIARASKLFLLLWLKPSNILLKFGISGTYGSGMPKVRKLAKYVLNLWVNISRTKTAIEKKACRYSELNVQSVLTYLARFEQCSKSEKQLKQIF